MLLLMLSYLLISFPALFVTMDTFQMMHIDAVMLKRLKRQKNRN
jgi:hypothetical protein